jgi:hypothetical protein
MSGKYISNESKVAITAFASVMVTSQSPLLVQVPSHPLNVEPLSAAAVKETIVP